jgi:hypothetical protein
MIGEGRLRKKTERQARRVALVGYVTRRGPVKENANGGSRRKVRVSASSTSCVIGHLVEVVKPPYRHVN